MDRGKCGFPEGVPSELSNDIWEIVNNVSWSMLLLRDSTVYMHSEPKQWVRRSQISYRNVNLQLVHY